MTHEADNKIFRYKLSDSVMEHITEFARIHQYDDRHTYKAAWVNWLKEKAELTEREVSRLALLNYKGNVIDKMFKAGRYYFREKVITNTKAEAETEAEAPDVNNKISSRTYIVMHKDIIQQMDTQLTAIIHTPNFKPAHGFQQFCEQYIDMLRREIVRLADEEDVNAKTIASKIKKTYKNRYFMLTNQRNLKSA